MAGQGGFATRLNGTVNFPWSTSWTAVSQVTNYVAEVVSITPPELTKTDIDVSSMDSAENFMEFIGGSTDGGIVDVELNYDASEDDLIIAALNDANEKWYLTFQDGSNWQTVGYLNKHGGGTAGTNEKVGRILSLKCSGVPTHATSINP